MRQQRNEKPLEARTFFYHLDGRVEKIIVNVVEYDEKMKKFIVEYKMPDGSQGKQLNGSNVVRKQSGRLNLAFLEFDSEEKLQKRFTNAQKRRKTALIHLGQERIIL